MNFGKMYNSGDVILTKIQFSDTSDIKIRPAVVLYEELNNIVVAGITSNIKMQGIPLSKKDGAIKDCIIKLNYIFTISNLFVFKKLFHLNRGKKRMIYMELKKRLKRFK